MGLTPLHHPILSSSTLDEVPKLQSALTWTASMAGSVSSSDTVALIYSIDPTVFIAALLPTQEEFQNIDYKEAQKILINLFMLEAPWLFLTAKDFAFLRAFGITKIAKTSVKAKKMVEETGLRYSDTLVFATEWILNPLDSERAILSINREPEMLYTLCLLMCEIFDWIDKYEWRQSVPLERYASHVMGIAENVIPKSYEECVEFIKEFEAAEMHPSDDSERIAHGIIKLYESTLPSFMRRVFTHTLISFMGPRLRAAMGLESRIYYKQNTAAHPLHPQANSFAIVCFRARQFRLSLLLRPITMAEHTSSTGRCYLTMRPLRYGTNGVLTQSTAGCLAWIFPEQWKSQGYKIEEVGYGGRGSEKVLEVLEKAKTGGCPYSTFGRVSDERELGGIFERYGTCTMAVCKEVEI
ncbi:hypothetical protein BKA70DRAFT_1249538 [Coprinopsis sp. MPI-PUGE-AT-0042]|nr:hypothetical protein BKA70DRAFT_1249538 [Coprinopsis sp. MPI-PUGE-AT-0042]